MKEKDVRVSGGTAYIETGGLRIVKRSVCLIASCNYKCINTGLLRNTAVFCTFICYQSE